MFGKLGDIGALMKKAQEMQSNIGKMKEELAKIEVTGSSGGTFVEVLASADFTIKKVKINPECLKPEDAEMVEDMVLAAVNDALGNAKKEAQQQMSKLTGGLSIPGLF